MEEPPRTAGQEPAWRRVYLVAAYWLSWIAFPAFALGFSVFVCLPLLLLGKPAPARRFARWAVSKLMNLWVWWLHFTGVAQVRYEGFLNHLDPGVVYVANHPSLLDATFLLARMPHAVCILKPALLRNPATGPAAVLAGYPSAAAGLDLFKGVMERLAEGCSVLIFPEGRRTQTGSVLNPFKPGFAVIAERAGAPVQSIVIRTSRGLVRRGDAWWRPPGDLPARITLRLDRRWEPCPGRTPAELGAEVEEHLRRSLEGSTV